MYLIKHNHIISSFFYVTKHARVYLVSYSRCFLLQSPPVGCLRKQNIMFRNEQYFVEHTMSMNYIVTIKF